MIMAIMRKLYKKCVWVGKSILTSCLVVGGALSVSADELSSPEQTWSMSDSTFVFIKPETSFFWHMATNSTMTLPVDFPEGATSATLVVTGMSYSVQYTGITEDEFTLTLPAATGPAEENVYGLELTFDNGAKQTASLGLLKGIAAGGTGSTRCIAPFGGKRWCRVERRAVLPVPYGVKSFSFQADGQSAVAETGLDGAAGWYAFKLGGGGSASVTMTDADDADWSVSLLGMTGVLLLVR
jgi:hypothetical protein